MLHMCVYMHSRFVENHPIRILEDGPIISVGVLSQNGGLASLILFSISQWFSNIQILSNLYNMKRVLPGLQRFPDFTWLQILNYKI
jgi:hypothetical protein